MGYTAYNLTKDTVASLKKIFPPKFSKVIAHHITVDFGVGSNHPLPSKAAKLHVVGYVCDPAGLETLVVKVNGKSRRSDGSMYHITWSLQGNFKPVDSNKLITKGNIDDVFPIPINAVPTYNK